jgi:glutamyl-Q tRNA(Asp) synthetase
VRFDDRVQGPQVSVPAEHFGDFLIFRREGLPAYHLANVLDDALLEITDVVRGADLLDVTPLHVYLHETLRLRPPRYAHLPVIVNRAGLKLSKQTGAAAVDARNPSILGARVLERLGLAVPPEAYGAAPHELWQWASSRWAIEPLRDRLSLPEG